MGGRGRAIAFGVGGAALVLALAWGLREATAPGNVDGVEAARDAARVASDDPEAADGDDGSPFAASDAGGSGMPEAGELVSGRSADEARAGGSDGFGGTGADERGRADVVPLEGPVDVTALGRGPLEDDALEALVARLAVDPELLGALVDEFRSEGDPARLERLSRILGELGAPEATTLAAELVFSGDETSRAIGLDLLRQVQPESAEARDIAASLLATETDGDALLPTLQVLAKEAVDVDAETRGALSAQMALLTGHGDARVRRRSLDMLARWSDDPAHLPVLLDGLADPEAKVRETAAYAFVGRDDPDGSVVPELFAVIENDAETERARRGAILALKGMDLDERARARVREIERALDRRPR